MNTVLLILTMQTFGGYGAVSIIDMNHPNAVKACNRIGKKWVSNRSGREFLCIQKYIKSDKAE